MSAGVELVGMEERIIRIIIIISFLVVYPA